MNPATAERVCEVINRAQSGVANRVDAELLETLAREAQLSGFGEAARLLANASVAIEDGDLLEAIAELERIPLARQGEVQ